MTGEGSDREYARARERYAEIGVDTDAALAELLKVRLSLPVWQLDDVAGFENEGAALSGGGLAVTGRGPRAARGVEEVRAALDAALAQIPGRHRVNLHAIYGEFGGKRVDRDEVEYAHFAGWVEWAKERGLLLDMNCTCFSHPKADSGFTLAARDPGVRRFWIEHARRCREIGAAMGRALGAPAVHNLWIPDGAKEVPADRTAIRETLRASLDEVYAVRHDPACLLDSVESKLFGIGSESFVAGSHEFYLAYALTRGLLVCFDTGHFHPTESVADKLSSWLAFAPALLLHLSRGVRWDSDHVPLLDDGLKALMAEAVRCGLSKVHLALDFFDGSLPRAGALALGARAVQKAILLALLTPHGKLRELDASGDTLARLSLEDSLTELPFGAVWSQAGAGHTLLPGSDR